MVKSLIIEDNIHELIIEKQAELKKKYNVDIKISSIVESILMKEVPKYDISIENKCMI